MLRGLGCLSLEPKSKERGLVVLVVTRPIPMPTFIAYVISNTLQKAFGNVQAYVASFDVAENLRQTSQVQAMLEHRRANNYGLRHFNIEHHLGKRKLLIMESLPPDNNLVCNSKKFQINVLFDFSHED
ncbi:Uncharacterized protein Fot_27901 [Forsythia ovata]|uniref:Uncharacterized protein n=1 Tax=Forsythia ovata TaxID=205694 RepID=A0ABD1TMG4_9LAMI